MRISIFLIAVVSVSVLGVSLWSFWLVTHPPKIQLPSLPSDFNLPAKDITLVTQDGLDLSAWYARSESGRGAIIFLHGYPTQKGDLLPLAKGMYPTFSVLLLDFRSFGDSQGNFSTLGLREQYDVTAAVNFLEEEGYKRIGVFGFSLGGATALMCAAADPRTSALMKGLKKIIMHIYFFFK